MAAESIGSLVPTKIPGLADQADIQAALRVYHYGSYTFDTAETDPAELVNPSIAYTINDLQDQIDTLSGGTAISATSFNAKGDLLSASANDTLSVLSVGSNGTVLTANSATATGLEWVSPEVTLSNSVTLSGKTLTAPRFADLGFIADANGNELLVMDTVTSAVNEIKIANAATAGKPSIAAQGGDTNISLNLISKGSGEVQSNGIRVATDDDILLSLVGGL
jgi:uncharacterized protein YaiE (UPF0345 family)